MLLTFLRTVVFRWGEDIIDLGKLWVGYYQAKGGWGPEIMKPYLIYTQPIFYLKQPDPDLTQRLALKEYLC